MTSFTFLSIILPTYNRKYCIKRMIDSVLRQNFQNFELIIVDDGSTDGTFEMLEESYQDKRIKLVRKENGGVSSARNLGISLARGEYITFVDSDDYLLDGFFEDISQKIDQFQCDVLVYGGYALEKKKRIEVPLFWKDRDYGRCETTTNSGSDFVRDFCLFGGNSWGCAKVFKRELVVKHNICFHIDITYGEDMLFNLQAYFIASTVVTSPRKFYVCDTETESLGRGGVDMKTKARNLLAAFCCLSQYKQYQSCLAYNYLCHLRRYLFIYFLLNRQEKEQIRQMCNYATLTNCHWIEKVGFQLAKISVALACLYLGCLPIMYSVYSKFTFLHPIICIVRKCFKRKSK